MRHAPNPVPLPMLLLTLVIIAFAMTGVTLAATLPPVMPVEAVTTGQHGYGKTVVSGTSVETFDVEVLGLVRGQGPSQSLILVRVSGPLIERTGGIAAGMSGSPVYIDGELLGALAYGFDNADHTIGLVTPAVDMLQVYNLLQLPAQSVAGGAGDKQYIAFTYPDSVVISDNPAAAAALRRQVPASTAIAYPVATPLLVSGLGERSAKLLNRALQPYNIMSVPAGKAPFSLEAPPLEPGSGIGVQLVRGDVELTALGTVTLVANDGFVGFGHPYLNRGAVNFFATGAYIHQVVQSMQVPFKVGAPTAGVGRLVQDRGAGVAGLLGSDPEYLSIQVVVNDKSLQRTQHFQAQVVYDETLTVPLVAITLLEALDRALDRIGRGTAQVSVTVDGAGLPGPLQRDNMFFSNNDISAASLGELIYAVQQLLGNDLAAIRLQNINFTAEVSGERQTARIEKASTQQKEVKPGSAVDIEVSLRPYRGNPVAKTLRLEIPADAPAGPISISVRGGGYGIPRLAVSDVTAQLEQPGEDNEEDADTAAPDDIEKFLTSLFESDRNNELVAEYIPEDVSGTLDKDARLNAGKAALPGQRQAKVKMATEYYIQGSADVTCMIVSAESNEPAETDTNTTGN